jgi:hypothetical protein
MRIPHLHPTTSRGRRRAATPMRKLLGSVLVLGVVGSAVAIGTYSAFTATTTNSGNTYEAGSVSIGQHAGSTTLYTGTNKKPTDSTSGCVRVTYSGSLTAPVKLYVSSGITNGSSFNLKVERGSGLTTLDNTMSCSGFSSSSTPYDGSLASFPTTYAGGIDGKASAATWAQNDSVDYKFTVSVVDDSTPNAHTSTQSTGSHTFTWEARSN